MSTYPSTTFTAARTFPLATGLLLARHRADMRSGGESAGNPLVAAIVAARAKTRRFYEKHFRIVKH